MRFNSFTKITSLILYTSLSCSVKWVFLSRLEYHSYALNDPKFSCFLRSSHSGISKVHQGQKHVVLRCALAQHYLLCKHSIAKGCTSYCEILILRVPGFRSLRFLETLLYLPAQQKQSIDLMQKKIWKKIEKWFSNRFLILITKSSTDFRFITATTEWLTNMESRRQRTAKNWLT